MNENAVSGIPPEKASIAQEATKKFGLFFCGACIVGWTALAVLVVTVTLAKLLGHL